MNPIQAVDKQSVFTELAMKSSNIRLYTEGSLRDRDNKLFVVDTDSLTVCNEQTLMDYKSGGGYFFQHTVFHRLIRSLGSGVWIRLERSFNSSWMQVFLR